jgi:uncharacterized membrane protein YedE/YeeE
VSPAELFLGGFLLLAGATMANGCTSGVGITSVGHQSFIGLIGTACMFGAAILVRRTFY